MHTTSLSFTVALALACSAGPLLAAGTAATAKVVLKNAQNQDVGAVVLRETTGGVLATIALKGLTPGRHGFHVHETGKCEPPAFKTAGGHFNPKSHKHGYEAAEGFHAGDLPNLFVAADGTVALEVMIPDVTLAEGKPNSLLDADGSALVVHAAADDYVTDPAGNAGDRVACGVISKVTP